jgi:hypothetical protein
MSYRKKLLDSVTLVRYIRPTLHNCIEMTAPPLRAVAQGCLPFVPAKAGTQGIRTPI